jgi:CRP/FNR family cyclic AMP-dependent transcriptional regulator
MLFFI